MTIQAQGWFSGCFIVVEFRDAKKVYRDGIAEHTFESVLSVDPQTGDTFTRNVV